MLNLLKLLAEDALSKFHWKIPLLIFLMVISGILEGLAIASALPLLQVLDSNSGSTANSANSSSFISIILEIANFLGLKNSPTDIGIFMCLLISASAIFFLLMARLSASLQVQYVKGWQTKIFVSSLAAGPIFLDNHKSGDVVASIVTEANRIGGAFYHGSILSASIVNLLIYLLITIIISPVASLSIIMVGFALFIITRPLMTRAFSFGKAISEAQTGIQIWAEEGVSISKAIKVNVAEDFFNDKFKVQTNKLAHANFNNAFDIQKAKAVFEFGGAICLAAVLIFVPTYLEVSVTEILVILALFVRLLPRVSALQQSLQSLHALLPALSKINNIIRQAQSFSENEDNRLLPSHIANSPQEIQFKNVTITRGNKEILSDLNMVFPAGKTIAIVGKSGSGKSTLVDAILGLVEARSGSIFIGGENLGNLPRPAWRKVIGYVAQDIGLFSGSVEENIAMGARIKGSDIEFALQKAAADIFISERGGIDLDIGSGGVKLSGGERQRIGLARALLMRRQLFIFDEATSALDTKTESKVLETMLNLSGKSTVIVIAHRFSAVQNADLIFVLDNGKVLEQGTWESLNKKGTNFHSLLMHQNFSDKQKNPSLEEANDIIPK